MLIRKPARGRRGNVAKILTYARSGEVSEAPPVTVATKRMTLEESGARAASRAEDGAE